MNVPVITIDGPTASGKGTLAEQVAKVLGWHYLDSGSLYRAVAYTALQRGISLSDADSLASVAARLPVRFGAGKIWLEDCDVSDCLREERVGNAASQISALEPVRTALLALQHNFRRAPGLVADGRDMGTVIFPDAPLKVFLTADAPTRAQRRHKQLINKGFSATLEGLLVDLQARDARDETRAHSPTKPAADAKLLDNSSYSIDECVDWVLKQWKAVST